MASTRKLVALMHGFGEEEILVPILRRLRKHFDIVIDARRDREGALMAAIGGARSLCGGKDDSVKLERQQELSTWVFAQKPLAIITGLHSGDQKRIAAASKSKKGVRCIGLVEMALPSGRHDHDKGGSSIRGTLAHLHWVLVPEVLKAAFESRFDDKRPISYGAPEPWNCWVEERGDRWHFRNSQNTSLGEALRGRLCFVGQHHPNNGKVLARVAKALPKDRQLAFLAHPEDRRSKRTWSMPPNCVEVPAGDHYTKLHVLRTASGVVTEYSNMGYSVALAGIPTCYVYEDPATAKVDELLVHLAVQLGKQGDLPVKLAACDGAANALEELADTSTPSFRPHLDIEPLISTLKTA